MEQVEVINYQGQVVNSLTLNPLIWQVPLSTWNISLANRYHFAQKHNLVQENKKSRGEVSGGGKKPWRQKGLGRARQGSIRAPQWRGGGVVFGPTGEKKHLPAINKKSKKKALQTLLAEKMRNKEIIIVDRIKLDNYKTKSAQQFLTNFPKQKTLLVFAHREEKKEELIRSFRNLANITLSDSNLLTVPQMLSRNSLIFTQSAFHEIEKKLAN